MSKYKKGQESTIYPTISQARRVKQKTSSFIPNHIMHIQCHVFQSRVTDSLYNKATYHMLLWCTDIFTSIIVTNKKQTKLSQIFFPVQSACLYQGNITCVFLVNVCFIWQKKLATKNWPGNVNCNFAEYMTRALWVYEGLTVTTGYVISMVPTSLSTVKLSFTFCRTYLSIKCCRYKQHRAMFINQNYLHY